jgi:L-ascorbate metabolism protein UlaG (beta-lactamase superfamily)
LKTRLRIPHQKEETWGLSLRQQLAVALALALLQPAPFLAQQSPAAPGRLSVRIKEGHNAENDVHQKRAVTPLVEIRDANGRPAAGAEVTFELPGSGPGGSFSGWMRAQTVRSDEAGRAAPTNFMPNGETGPFEIRVSAASGTLTGKATIAQTNVPVTARPTRHRRNQRSRRGLPILIVAGVGLSVAATTLALKTNPGSASGWLTATMTGGSVLGLIAILAKRSKGASDKLPATGGPIEIEPLYHATMMIRAGGAVVYVDPTREAGCEGGPKADLILITDAYADHFDPAALPLLSKAGTVVYGPAAAARGSQAIQILRNGDRKNWKNWEIEAVPAYSLPHNDPSGRVFHEKGFGNGYVLSFGGKRIYISGNTANTPEMRALRDIDVAFLCMSPPYTMSAEEAAAAARTFKPKVLYPYHYRGNLLSVFRAKNSLADTSIEFRYRNWYK